MVKKNKIFISHAAKDKDLADKVVDVLLNNGCDVPAAEIFCTSLEGVGIPPGTKNFIELIRQNIQSPSLVILLLTENYFCSTFCQCELGAAWGMDLPTFTWWTFCSIIRSVRGGLAAWRQSQVPSFKLPDGRSGTESLRVTGMRMEISPLHSKGRQMDSCCWLI